MLRFRYLEEECHPLQAGADALPSRPFHDSLFYRLLRGAQLLRVDLVWGTALEGEVIIYDDQLVLEFLRNYGKQGLVGTNPMQG